jgi:2-phospho-L-lactate guanylyltransferase
MSPDCLLLIPVKSLHAGKTRLGPAFSASFRRRLNEDFLLHMLRIAVCWPGMDKTVIVSPCDDALRIAQRHGARVLRQPSDAGSDGLNAALAFAFSALRETHPADILVASCDLPLASVADLREMARIGHSGHVGHGGSGGSRLVVAADHTGTGTNGLFVPLSCTPAFHFGRNSNQRHREMALARGIPFVNVAISGLSRDIDTPEDYYAWRSAAGQAWHAYLDRDADGVRADSALPIRKNAVFDSPLGEKNETPVAVLPDDPVCPAAGSCAGRTAS